MKFIVKFFISLVALTPMFVFAQITFKALTEDLIDLIRYASLIVMSLAVVIFLWGVVRFVYSSGDSKANEDGKNIMIWGIVGLFVLFSIWGILGVLKFTFDV